MSKEFDQSNGLLGKLNAPLFPEYIINFADELEDLLKDFKGHLGNIKGEMTSLQDRSLILNTSLSNRKKLQRSLDTFISNVMLEPQLIYDICNKEVNEDYVDYIRVLCGKLDYIKENSLADHSTVKELGKAYSLLFKVINICLLITEPELNRLKHKACQRVRKFLFDKLELLKKPKTNIQILQNNVLLKFKVFMTFLKDNYIDVFIEVCNLYTETMNRMYFSHFKAYIKDINTLISEVYLKTDTVLNDNIPSMRKTTTCRATNLIPDKRTIFSLMGRESTLITDEDPIIIHVANQRNQRYTSEVVFKSINKLLLESVISEFVFTMEFFSLKNEQNKVVINGIFKNTIAYIQEYTQGLFQMSFDSLAVLLSLVINDKNRKNYNSKGLTVLDAYFDKQYAILWMRFITLFDNQVASILNMRVDSFKIIEKNLSLHEIILRFVDLALSYYKIYAENNDNHMLRYRISQFKNQFLELLKRYTKEFKTEKEKIKFLVESLDFMIEQFKTGPVLEEDLRSLEKELEVSKDRFVECALKEYFEHLVEFVRKYASEENENEIKSLNAHELQTPVSGMNNMMRSDNKSSIENGKQNVNKELVKNIASDFKETWERKVGSFKDFSKKAFSSPRVSFTIIKMFLRNILGYYNSFSKYVGNNFPDLKSSILPSNVLMKEVNSQLNSMNNERNQ